jgi:hypothetical protein
MFDLITHRSRHFPPTSSCAPQQPQSPPQTAHSTHRTEKKLTPARADELLHASLAEPADTGPFFFQGTYTFEDSH